MGESKKSCTPRIPVAVDGIQVNFCKNPVCKNFGKPASQERTRPKNEPGTGNYKRDGKGRGKGKTALALECKECGESFTMKSNLAIAEELRRMSNRLLKPHVQLRCPDAECENSHYSLMTNPRRYFPFGETTAGNPRFRCGKCGKSYTVKQQRDPLSKQKAHRHLNRIIFLELVNKMPFRGIISVHEISMQTVYNKLDFFYRQCVAFVANRERKFAEREFRTLYIPVDRQHYRLNWADKNDRRNTILYGIGSTDKFSGYTFCQHINYDSGLDPEIIEEDASDVGDYDQKYPLFRKYARLWLKHDSPLPPKGPVEEIEKNPSIITNVKRKYAEAVVRADIEVSEELPQSKNV